MKLHELFEAPAGETQKAFQLGHKAFYAKENKNPFTAGSEEAKQWDLGWQLGQNRSKDKSHRWDSERVAMEGRFIKGPGGVPLDRQGKPIPPKVKPFKEPVVKKPAINLDQIFYDLSSIIGTFFPDGDPADYFPKYYRKHGIDYEIARKAFKKNGYEDEYDYIDKMKEEFPMSEGFYDGKDEFTTKGDRGKWDPNASDYKGDYGGAKNFGKREREDDERHDLDPDIPTKGTKPWWYLKVDGKVKDKDNGDMLYFETKDEARKAGMALLKDNPGSKIVLTTNPF